MEMPDKRKGRLVRGQRQTCILVSLLLGQSSQQVAGRRSCRKAVTGWSEMGPDVSNEKEWLDR